MRCCPEAASRFVDHRCAEVTRDIGRPVGGPVVDDDGTVSGRQCCENLRKSTRLVQTGQDDVHCGVHDVDDTNAKAPRGRGCLTKPGRLAVIGTETVRAGAVLPTLER